MSASKIKPQQLVSHCTQMTETMLLDSQLCVYPLFKSNNGGLNAWTGTQDTAFPFLLIPDVSNPAVKQQNGTRLFARWTGPPPCSQCGNWKQLACSSLALALNSGAVTKGGVWGGWRMRALTLSPLTQQTHNKRRGAEPLGIESSCSVRWLPPLMLFLWLYPMDTGVIFCVWQSGMERKNLLTGNGKQIL